jgi:hypothetical protein
MESMSFSERTQLKMIRKTLKNLTLSFLLGIVILTLAGCVGKISTRTSTQELGGFLGGDEGLVIKVLEGAPPKVIQDKGLTPFTFLLTLENAGEARVGAGTDNPLVIARLLGIQQKNFGLTQETAAKRFDGSLEKARRNIDGTISPGEITDFAFENMSYFGAVPDSMAFTIRAEVCYDYESFATTKFCMKKDIFESAQDSTICMLKGPRDVGNSGAPLHVTSVDEAPMAPNQIQLNFNIEHYGHGVYFARNEPADDYDACVFSDTDPNIYKIEVTVEPVQQDTYSLNCLRLDEKLEGGGVRGVIRTVTDAPTSVSCFITRTKDTGQRVYEDLLNIKLRYRYGEFVEVPILVQGHP